MPKIDGLLKLAIAEKASDIHISSNEPMRIRVDGDLQLVSEKILSPEQVTELLFELLSEEEQKKFIQNKNLDKSINIAEAHFRVNIFSTRRGPAAVLRTIPKKVPTMAELFLPPAIEKLTNLPKGLVLVTGPTGSGKSTTLAAMLHHINLTYKYHILTVEDPVEFVHESKQSLINQREIGSNCHTFSDALKYALREDPDVILVGEMRDLETIGLALTAAETGHLVFGTLHTRGAAASVDRIIDSFPANQQAMIRTMLSESLAAVISQCLIKRAEGRGRVAAYEILLVNTAIANLIREGKTFQMPSIIQTSRKDGMVLMEQSILELVQKKIVTAEDAVSYLDDPAILGTLLKSGINSSSTQPSITVLTQTSPSLKMVPGKPPVPPAGLKQPPSAAPPTQKVTPPSPIAKLAPKVATVAPPTSASPQAAVISNDDLESELMDELPPDSPEVELDGPLESIPAKSMLSMDDLSDPGIGESLELTNSPIVSEIDVNEMLSLGDEELLGTYPTPAPAAPAAPSVNTATVPKAVPNSAAAAKPAPAAPPVARPTNPAPPRAMPVRPGPPPVKKVGNG